MRLHIYLEGSCDWMVIEKEMHACWREVLAQEEGPALCFGREESDMIHTWPRSKIKLKM